MNITKENKARIDELVSKLNAAADAYYNEDKEIIGNYEYDALYDELEKLQAETGYVPENSPTLRVGADVRAEAPDQAVVLDALIKVPHEHPMLSLDKTKEPDKLAVFLGLHTGVLSWKMDGLTVVAYYENGELKQAVTRGNGLIGEDITHNAKVFANMPTRIADARRLTLRGEAVISYSDFERINAEIPEEAAKYKNPRNLCSGTVRQLNSAICAKRNVKYFVFSVSETGSELPDSKFERLSYMRELGFDTVECVLVNAENVHEALKGFEARIEQNDFGSDGLVLTYDSVEYSQSLGATSKFPRDSLAFKWKDELAETVLKDVEWNTSRTGLINPVAIFEPVEIEGTTVSRAALHNLSILRQLKLGYGDHILVYKANMIIPQIERNLTGSDTVEIPTHCPVCGGETVVENEDFLYCRNDGCTAQLVRGLSHFVSRDAMNIEGLSEQTLSAFVDKGFLRELPDLYRLEEHADEIRTMEGFGEKSCANLLAAIDKSREVNMHNLINALGIPGVGLAGAKSLCRHFEYDMERVMAADAEQIEEIDGFGEIVSKSVADYFADTDKRSMVEKLLNEVKLQRPEIKHMNQQGFTFVITGSLKLFENRRALQEYLESRGHKVASSVTSKTDYLINNDTTSGSSKNKKAMELGVKIIDEQELTERVIR